MHSRNLPLVSTSHSQALVETIVPIASKLPIKLPLLKDMKITWSYTFPQQLYEEDCDLDYSDGNGYETEDGIAECKGYYDTKLCERRMMASTLSDLSASVPLLT